MSYCVNPDCPNPKNPNTARKCQACGTSLLLRGRYVAIEVLGQGGFGATFVARDLSLPGQPTCAIKQLRPASTASNLLQMARDLFEREAKTLGKIGNHPQVPRLLDYFEADRQFYLIQEYVSGATIKRELKKTGLFDEQRVRQFLQEILPVLQYIHSCQVIHRDIKPANIIRRKIDKKLVLIDFGAVKDQVSQTMMMGEGSGQTALTSIAIGTPGFAPPEQMALRPVYSSDIYALGVTCLYLLTGKSPKHLGYDTTTGEIAWRDRIRVSEQFSGILEKMLEVSVRHRYQSAVEVLEALEQPATATTKVQSRATHLQPSHSTEEDTEVDVRSDSFVPQTTRLARAIRARKEGQTFDKLGDRTTGSGSRSFSPRPSSGRSSRMSVTQVKTNYRRGERDFSDCDLGGLDLQQLDLSQSNFREAKLVKTNLKEADLRDCDFGQASLNYAILRDTNLSHAYLSYANLGGADLRGADLTNAYLRYANLREANLCGADLTDAKVSDEQLAMAKTNWRTKMPSGKMGLFT